MRKQLKRLTFIVLFAPFVLATVVGTMSHPAATEEARFIGTVSGDITGGPTCRINTIRPKETGVVFRRMTLNQSYFQTLPFRNPGDGARCFPDQFYTSVLALRKEKGGSAIAQRFFNAYANDGFTEVKYELRMYGSFDNPWNWPPANGSSNTVRLTHWELLTEGRGQSKNISCTGSGEFPNGVVVVVERNDSEQNCEP